MATNLRYLLVVLLAVFGTTLTAVTSASVIQPRMSNGASVDTLRRFPHHVTIEPIYEWYGNVGPKLCGGSILNKNWIVTSAYCVKSSIRLILHFEKLYKNSTSGSYSIVINNNAQIYPTESDDVALVQVPVNLKFSSTIKPIEILETSVELQQNKLAVVPGFNFSQSSTQATPMESLTYAMLNVVPNSVCSRAYKPDAFDEYLNVCTEGWGTNRNTPCGTDFGNGLIAGWPANSKLFGIYAVSSYDCDANSPSVFINIQKYKSWIDSVIWDNIYD